MFGPPFRLIRGSPPHLRGTQEWVGRATVSARITPAPAGNTTRPGMALSASEDHPRTCGEHGARACKKRSFVGITPAPAGNTILISSMNLLAEDHPRTCGEHEVAFKKRAQVSGSPPHLRGTRNDADNFTFPGGITPAPAGNTGDQPKTICIRRDHPRTCGEHSASIPGCIG